MAKRIYGKRILIVLVISLAASACALAAFFLFYENPLDLRNVKNPSEYVKFDLNGDAELEKGIVKNGRAKILQKGETIFESEQAWDVREIIAGDFNYDGQNDFALSLWKYGNYGSSLPFWVEENDNSYKMHLFLYTFKNGKVWPLWHSSNLPYENFRVRFMDYNGDDRKELVTWEKAYENDALSPDSIGIWRFRSWGFELLKRLAIW